jgi:hypothetical protein
VHTLFIRALSLGLSGGRKVLRGLSAGLASLTGLGGRTQPKIFNNLFEHDAINFCERYLKNAAQVVLELANLLSHHIWTHVIRQTGGAAPLNEARNAHLPCMMRRTRPGIVQELHLCRAKGFPHLLCIQPGSLVFVPDMETVSDFFDRQPGTSERESSRTVSAVGQSPIHLRKSQVSEKLPLGPPGRVCNEVQRREILELFGTKEE